MKMMDLANQLLSPAERAELEESLDLLERGEASAFYERNQVIVHGILFLRDEAEFLDFSSQDRLDRECFCAAFLCARGYGLQVGGYEEDLTEPLTDFFEGKDLASPELLEIINREVISTDCGDFDNFKEAVTDLNRVLEPRGLRLAVWEDCVYCDCEYTIVLLERPLAEQAAASWQSESLERYI